MSETETPEKTEKAPRVKNEQQNGVSKPKAGTKTGRVWEISNELSAAQGSPAARKDVIERASAEGINPATIATQYGRWRQFHGLGKPAKEKPAKAEKTGDSDTTVE